jgi:hypothetical protein
LVGGWAGVALARRQIPNQDACLLEAQVPLMSELLDSALVKDGTPDLTKFLSNTIEKFTEKQTKTNTTSPRSRTSSSHEDIALNKTLMDFYVNNLESFDAYFSATPEEMFPANGNKHEPPIFIEDEAYDFPFLSWYY